MSDDPRGQGQQQQRVERSEQQDRPPERTAQEEANERLRQEAGWERYGNYGDVEERRAGRTADARDRAAFREECQQMLGDFRGGLTAASDSMRELNRAAQHGMRPGTSHYEQLRREADGRYMQLSDQQTKLLFQTDREGRPVVDRVTGQYKLSEFGQALETERRLLDGEIRQLQETVRAGRELTPQEMERLGVNSPDARRALEQKVREDAALLDLRRSAGYAEANHGLALMRHSGHLQGQDRAADYVSGQRLLMYAAKADPWMVGPPPDANYAKHHDRVQAVANGLARDGGDPRRAQSDSRGQGDGRGQGDARVQGGDARQQGDRQAAERVTAPTVRNNVYIDGDLRLPQGNLKPGDQGYANPLEVMPRRDQLTANALAAPQRQSFEQAVQAADSLDRMAIRRSIDDLNAAEAALGRDPDAARKRQRAEQQLRTEGAARDAARTEMQNLRNPVLQEGGDTARSFLSELQKIRSSDQLNRFLNENRQQADAFRAIGGGKGAEFLNHMQRWTTHNDNVRTVENQLNRLDPARIEAARRNLQDQMMSSVTTRAAYIGELRKDAETNPESRQRMTQLMSQMAVMDGNLRRDPAFQQESQRLGIDLNAAQQQASRLAGSEQQGQGQAQQRAQGDRQQGGAQGVQGDQRQGQQRQGDASQQRQGTDQQRAATDSTSGIPTRTNASMQEIVQSLQAMDAANQEFMRTRQLTPQMAQAFEQAVANSASITPELLQRQQQQLRQELYSEQPGRPAWNDQKEAEWTRLQNDANTKFAALSPQTQTQIRNVIAERANIPENDPNRAARLQSIDSQLQTAAMQDPKGRDWLTAQQAFDAHKTRPENAKRAAYDDAIQNLGLLQNARALTSGYYAAALIESGNAQRAAGYVAEVQRNPQALQQDPDLARRLERHIATMTNAGGDQRVEQQAQQQAAVANDPVARVTAAGNAYGEAERLAATLQPGQKLTADQERVFQNAITAMRAVTPQDIDAAKQFYQQVLTTEQNENGQRVPAWTQEKQQQYQQLSTALDTALRAVPADKQQQLNTLFTQLQQATDQNQQQQLRTQINNMGTQDQNVGNFLRAREQFQTFMQQPEAVKFQMAQRFTNEAEAMRHGNAIVAQLYAETMRRTGDQDSINRGKQALQAAITSDQAALQNPNIERTARHLGLVQDAIPGRTQLEQAQDILSNTSIPEAQRTAQALPLLRQAYEQTRTLSVQKMNQDIAAKQQALNNMTDLARQENPGQVQQLQTEIQTARQAHSVTTAANMLYGVHLFNEGVRGNKPDQIQQARQILTEFKQRAPELAQGNVTIAGMLAQVDRNPPQQVNLQNEAGLVLSGALGIADRHARTISGDSNEQVGAFQIRIPGQDQPLQGRQARVEDAAHAVVQAYQVDQAGTQAALDQRTSAGFNFGMNLAGDGAAGLTGLAATRALAPRIANALPGRLKPIGWGLSFLAGAGTAVGTKQAWDAGSHAVFGTEQHTLGENAVSSIMAYGGMRAVQGLAGRRAAVELSAANQSRLATIFTRAGGNADDLLAQGPLTGRTVADAITRNGIAEGAAMTQGGFRNTIGGFFRGATGRAFSNADDVTLKGLEGQLTGRNFLYNSAAGAAGWSIYNTADIAPGVAINPATGRAYTVGESLRAAPSNIAGNAFDGAMAGGLTVPFVTGPAAWAVGKVPGRMASSASNWLRTSLVPVASGLPAYEAYEQYDTSNYWRSVEGRAQELMRGQTQQRRSNK